MATIAACSDYDLTHSLSIRRGETWICQLGVGPDSISYCPLGTDQRHSRIMRFADQNSRTCVLIEADDYQPRSSVQPNESGFPVDIWVFTQITLPRGAVFALTCVGARENPPSIPWRCLYPAVSRDAQEQNSIWINIDTDVNLVVLRSEAEEFMSIAVGRHPDGWTNGRTADQANM